MHNDDVYKITQISNFVDCIDREFDKDTLFIQKLFRNLKIHDTVLTFIDNNHKFLVLIQNKKANEIYNDGYFDTTSCSWMVSTSDIVHDIK
jgi:hypothetical protein